VEILIGQWPEESPIGHNRKLQVAPPSEILNPFEKNKESKSTDNLLWKFIFQTFHSQRPLLKQARAQ
jgi:hypothetical protein